MSTRCQVKVQGTDINGTGAFTLYHHCDGYPEYMLPIIGNAYKDCWQAGRFGKAAVMVAAADPSGYELEQGHELHGDIEYYYVVEVYHDKWTIKAYIVPLEGPRKLIGSYSPEQAISYSIHLPFIVKSHK